MKEKKKTGKFFLIKMGIYPFDVMVSVDEPDDVLIKRLEKYGNDKEDFKGLMNLHETVRGRLAMLPSNQSVIRLVSQPTKHEMMNVISHEVFHSATYILDRIGMKFKLGTSDEAYAYLIGYLTTEIYKKLKL